MLLEMGVRDAGNDVTVIQLTGRICLGRDSQQVEWKVDELVKAGKNKVIFDNQNYIFRGEYEISGDPKSFFNEEGPATDRLAREFARSLVTTIWEGF